MKIAVCLSGQPRSIEFSGKSIKHLFDRHFEHVDYFCHSWLHNSWKTRQNSEWVDGIKVPTRWETIEETVDEEWLRAQLRFFNPKYVEIDGMNINDYNHKNNFPWGSLFFSVMRANKLKRQFEIENNFRYDAVFRVRYDAVFNPQQTIEVSNLTERTVYFSHCERMPLEYNRHNASDCLFYGDSWGMDIMTDVFWAAQKQKFKHRVDDFERFGPGTFMHQYAVRRSVVCRKPTSHLDEVFYRREALGLDPVADFQKVLEIHESFYQS